MNSQLSTLAACLQDAADRSLQQLAVLPHVVLEGEYLLVNDSSGQAVALACAVDPQQRPFEPTIRDRARAVATRSKAPLILICSWRTILVIHTESLIQRRPPSSWIAGIWEGARVTEVTEVLQSGKRAIVTEALKNALSLNKSTQTTWVANVLDEMMEATQHADANTISELLHLSSVPMSLPPAPIPELLLVDLINAYATQAYRDGNLGYPRLPDLQPRAELRSLFRSVLTEIVTAGNSTVGLPWDVEQMQQWHALAVGKAIPTVDAIDLALIAGGLDSQTTRTTSTAHHSVHVVESGSSLGRIAKRLQLLNTKAYVEVVANLDSEPSIMQRAIEQLALGPSSVLILFVPQSVLREAEYVSVRQALVHHLDIQWVIATDTDPMALPDNGTCCIVGVNTEFAVPTSVTRFVCLRMSLSGIIPPASSGELFDEKRIEALQQFVRYMQTGSHGKVNQEISVRKLERQTLFSLAMQNHSWDDLLIPPDVLASILRKVSPHLRTLKSCGTVFNGLRTGANDILIPSVADILEESLEPEYWQSQTSAGVVENIIVTSNDDVESIAGMAASDRRLLILPEDRQAMSGTKVNERLLAAEADGIHRRTSFANNEQWWHVTVPAPPHLIISKSQAHRWLVALNPSQAGITDVAIGVHLEQEQLAESVSLWLNSTLGLFYHLLMRRSEFRADVTMRDARELMIPDEDVLQGVDVKKFRDFLYRPQTTLSEEMGCVIADAVNINNVRRDRRRLDRMFMEDVFKLTPVEQRWVYRLVLIWRTNATNLRYLGNALAQQIAVQYKIKPMSSWYDVRITQLPSGTTQTFVIPPAITHATIAHGMFSWQLVLWEHSRTDHVVDCTSEAMAELMMELINLGKRTVELPTDLPLLQEVLPLVQSFARNINTALDDVSQSLPDDIRAEVTQHIRLALVTAF